MRRLGEITIGVAALLAAMGSPTAASADVDRLPAIQLTNFDGEEIGLDELGGTAAIVVFTYAKCDFACPMITYYFSSLDEDLGRPENLRYVHISVNPAEDTAEEIEKHFAKFKIDAREDRRWIFLNGPAESIDALLNQRDIEVVKKPLKDGILITHNIQVHVVAKGGEIVASFDSFLWEEERMNDALQIALGAE